MGTYTLQYDMGLRVWVLSGPAGQVMATYLSRAAALRDREVRRVKDTGGVLRIRNADGTFEPVERARAASVPVPVPVEQVSGGLAAA